MDPPVCFFFANGWCRYGSRCWFKHPSRESSPSPLPITPPPGTPDIVSPALVVKPPVTVVKPVVTVVKPAVTVVKPAVTVTITKSVTVETIKPVIRTMEVAPTAKLAPLTHREHALSVVKEKAGELIRQKGVCVACAVISVFLTTRGICAPEDVERVCLVATLDTPQNFLKAVLDLA